MGFALRAGVSFCLVADHALFLDLPRDRYFGLAGEVEDAFLRLVAGDLARSSDQQRLIDLGLVVPANGASLPQPCAAPHRSGVSLLDDLSRASRATGVDIARAFYALGATSARLKLLGLASMIATVRRHKAHLESGRRVETRVDRIVRAFQDTRYVVSEHDRCLVRSIAIARRLLTAGAAPDIVLAVKLQPFRAHCWVQIRDTLVNDRHDVVREYTPILVV